MRTSGRILRIGVTAFCTDFSVYLLWVAIPYKAIGLGAGAVYLGILPALFSTAYVVTTLVSGYLSDRYSRIRLARAGAGVFFLACLVAMQAETLFALAALLPLIAIGAGFFWAPVQAALADEADLTALERNVGFFNICWSVGKALGFLIGGTLYAWFGARPSFLVAAGLMALVALVLPAARPLPRRVAAAAGQNGIAQRRPGQPPRERRQAPGPVSGSGPVPAASRGTAALPLRSFLYMAWVANALGFGISSTLNTQYPKFLLQFGLRSDSFGFFLGMIFVVQTLSFVVLRHIGGWKFRRSPTFIVQGVMALAVGALPLLRMFPLILVTAVPIGIALGFAYHASITYSLMDHEKRGRRAGIHEAVLGVGSFSLPLLGGIVAGSVGDLRLPYWVCTAMIIAGLGLQQRLATRRRGARTGRSTEWETAV